MAKPSPRFVLTERAQKVMELARVEAEKEGCAYINTGHLMAGLLLEGEGIGMALLHILGFEMPDPNPDSDDDQTAAVVRDALRRLLGKGTSDA